MSRTAKIAIVGALFVFGLTGCESHQAKVDALQKEYDQLSAQMKKDCSAKYLKVPPILSQKCTDENKRVTDAWNRLQAERGKQ